MNGRPPPQWLAVRLAEEAAAAAPREACGLVACRDRRPVRVIPLPNSAPGRGRFQITPADLRRAVTALEERGWRAGALYHSHPRGPARPSAADLAGGWDPEWLSLVAGRTWGGWRVAWFSVRDGSARPLGSRTVRLRQTVGQDGREHATL